MTDPWDAIVIGTGPAGMAAAATLAEGGARVLVVDEQPEVGGQVYRAIERNRGDAALLRILGADYLHGAKLADRLRASGAEIRLRASVWWIDDDRGVWIRREGGVHCARARSIVLATGAMERAVPVPGWTLPGVMTVGALQILLKSAGLVPSQRLSLVGTGPLFYLFAQQCVLAGVQQLVLLDTAKTRDLLSALPLLPKAIHGEGWRYLAKGVALRRGLRRAGVTLYRGVSDITLEGETHVTAIRFRHGSGAARVECHTVGLHEGVIPQQDMTRALGCTHDFDPTQSSFRPRHDRWGATDRPGIFVAGDAGGIIGARASAHEGNIAALAILRELGHISDAQRDLRFASEDRARRAHLTVRPFLDRLYTPREEVLIPADPTIVCRCEAVTAGALRHVARRGVVGPNQAKAFLRCGMGPCQGRLCGPTVTNVLARETGWGPEETGYYRVRMPLKPISVGDLGGAEGQAVGGRPSSDE